MFPLSFQKTLIYKKSSFGQDPLIQIYFSIRPDLDQCEKSSNELKFANFSSPLNRHQWLDGGKLSVITLNDTVVVKLKLDFLVFPIIIAFASLLLIFWNLDKLVFALIGSVFFWFFYALLYLWTSQMAVNKISRLINKLTDRNNEC
jgi:hypothetical protein